MVQDMKLQKNETQRNEDNGNVTAEEKRKWIESIPACSWDYSTNHIVGFERFCSHFSLMPIQKLNSWDMFSELNEPTTLKRKSSSKKSSYQFSALFRATINSSFLETKRSQTDTAMLLAAKKQTNVFFRETMLTFIFLKRYLTKKCYQRLSKDEQRLPNVVWFHSCFTLTQLNFLVCSENSSVFVFVH